MNESNVKYEKSNQFNKDGTIDNKMTNAYPMIKIWLRKVENFMFITNDKEEKKIIQKNQRIKELQDELRDAQQQMGYDEVTKIQQAEKRAETNIAEIEKKLEEFEKSIRNLFESLNEVPYYPDWIKILVSGVLTPDEAVFLGKTPFAKSDAPLIDSISINPPINPDQILSTLVSADRYLRNATPESIALRGY